MHLALLLHSHVLMLFFTFMTFLFLLHPGLMDPPALLANIESQILKAKEESLSRKDIMDRINKWIAACDEEAWLEEYNQVL